MYVRLTTAQEYYQAFGQAAIAYAAQEFNRLVSGKAEMVRYAIGYDSDDGYPLIGLIVGRIDGQWRAPYSAPFTIPVCTNTPDLECIYDFINELSGVLAPAALTVTLAPAIYDPDNHAAYAGVMGNCADKCVFDYNFHYPLAQAKMLEKHMTVSFRNQWHQAAGNSLAWVAEPGIERAYACVKANHEAKRYPMRMSLQQVVDTSGCIPIDAFVVQARGQDIAGAIVYRLTPRIAQLIYWGDVPGHSALRPMNMMAVELVRHYARLGLEILDFGPASSRGIPAPGLCHFKRGLGCKLSLKPTFIFNN